MVAADLESMVIATALACSVALLLVLFTRRPLRAAFGPTAVVFDQASIDAAMKWKFHPRIERGRAVADRIRVPITFEPDHAPVAQ